MRFHLTNRGDVESDCLAIGVAYQDKAHVKHWGAGRQARRCRGNTWFVPYETIRRRDPERPHPAAVPVKIPRLGIRLHGVKKSRLIVNPFLGIGNKELACLELGIAIVGFEIDASCFSEARRAMQRARKT